MAVRFSCHIGGPGGRPLISAGRLGQNGGLHIPECTTWYGVHLGMGGRVEMTLRSRFAHCCHGLVADVSSFI